MDEETEPTMWATAVWIVHVDVRYLISAVARFTGSESKFDRTWGFAPLHPRLYALARSAAENLIFS